MNIIIGLGNPGKEYEKTRHNVGFLAIDKFAEKNNFPEFELDKKSNSLISEKNGVLLSKPQTFMNDSGKTAGVLLKNHKSQIENLVIIHDDIDLPVGKMKIVKDRGSAGHKGVESIIKAIGNENLVRIRIGIEPQDDIEAKKIVLKSFSEIEEKTINETIEKTGQSIDFLIKNGLDKAMNEYNK
jgi:PTH1 family peptidyl-tRNA hydrolase